MHILTALIFATLVACILGAPPMHWDPKVLGGEDAAPGEFPWMVSLRSSNRHFCGGTIISDTVILTASHCVVGKLPSSITVVSGTTTLSGGGNSHAVAKITTHEDYDSLNSWINDVAVLKLTNPITLGALEQPIPLPLQGQDSGDNDKALARASGWGYTSYPATTLPDNLQKVDMYLVSNADCNAAHSSPVHPTHICAGTVSGEGVCNGDSGGPLMINGTQIGIVSWGRPCAKGIPDVFTRVASYVDWIALHSV